MTMRFILDQADYDATAAQIGRMIDFSRYLPAQVFREVPRRYVFTDFDLLWYDPAWTALSALARYYGDRELLMIGNPPDGQTWIDGGFGHMGAARLAVHDTGYQDLVLREVPHPFQALVTELAVAVPSGGFAMWAGRSDNVAILALYDRPSRPACLAPFMIRRFTLDETIDMQGMQFSENAAPPDFAAQMRKNYGHSDC